MNLKFKTLIACVFLFSISGTCFGYLEENMYCNIINKNIKISINPKDGIKCKSYTKNIEQKMKTTYKDVLTIQKYINKKQDAGYWIPIKDIKVKQINDLQALRLNILASMKTFETSLFKKSQELFTSETYKYKTKLLATLTQIQSLSGTNLNKFNKQIQLMNNTLEVIKSIEEAKDFKTLTDEYRKFIYFKNQIEGK